jgi:pimeloyl-ACP methyl ester carboxylesterase
MSIFIFVHGAWGGGWCYGGVAKILRLKGHEVYTPTNTGLGERVHLYRPSISLETHVEDIMNVIKWEGIEDIMLVGHSYGGMIITVVADRIPEKIRTLVYLDAFVPEDGKCQFDYLPAERVEAMRRDAEAHNGRIAPMPAEALLVSKDNVAWMNSLSVPHPLRTFDEPVKLSGGLTRLRNKRVFIWSEGYAKGPFKQFYEVLAGDPTWRTSKIPGCGHMVMIDKPAELTDILLEFS